MALTLKQVIAVFAGGFCGTITRYGLSLLVTQQVSSAWPYDIFLINITGAFVLALFSAWIEYKIWQHPLLHLFLTVGFLGAYTTFSSLALGVILQARAEQYIAAVSYLGASIIGGLLAVRIGYATGIWIVRTRQIRMQ